MSSNKEIVPKLRFPGFTDAWEQRRFDSVFDPLPSNTLSRAELNYNDGNIKNVHYGDILIKYGAVTDCGKDVIPFITGAESSDYPSHLLQNGDVLLADAAEDVTVGKATEIAGITGIPVVSGLHTIACRPKVKMQPNFLGYYLNSPSYRQQLLPIMQGIKVLSISRTNLAKTIISYPTTSQEQLQIGLFFRNFDNLITLHQRKLNNVKNLKAGLLQKMFPKEGEDSPEVRFPGFTDAWEQLKLGDIGSVAMNKRIFKEQTSVAGEVPFYKIGTFGGVADAFITRKLFEEYKSNYPYPEVGDILISASGSIGRIVEYTGKDEYFQDSNIVWLKHDGRLNNSFLKQFYSLIKWQGLEGSTIKRLYNKNILDTSISVPSHVEQSQIGEIFNKLDRLITLHQRKLDHLQELKKALLQQMFV